jgi:hypothetical protein
MNQIIKPDSAAVHRVAAVIIATPGLRTGDVAAGSGYSASHTQNVLAVATKAGLVKAMHIKGRLYGWFPAAIAQQMQAERTAKAESEALRKASKPTPDRQIIREMAAGPDGATSAAIKALGIQHNSSSRHMVVLIQRGHIFRSERPGCRLRWFDTKARADSWAALPAMVPSEWEKPGKKAWEDHPARKRRMVAIGERIKSSARQPSKAPPLLKGSQRNKPGAELVVQQKPGKPAPVSIKAAKAQAADFSKAKKTIIPPPKCTYRWQAIPDSGRSLWEGMPRYGSGV